jgi:hypothetical protein
MSLLLLLLVVVLGCGRAIDRPLSGAAPGTAAAPTVGLPPTLSPSFQPLPSPSPGVASASASPSAVASPSPVAPPIVRTIAPAANASVPPGAPVTISAVLVGRGADLATASLAINGADSGAQIDKRTARDWTIHTTRPLGPGTYTARVQVRDASGLAGGFTWPFTVGNADEAPPPQATAPPKPNAVPKGKPAGP